MRRLFDVFDGVLLLLGVAAQVGQIHLAERTGADFALYGEHLAQLPERLVFRGTLCNNNNETASELANCIRKREIFFFFEQTRHERLPLPTEKKKKKNTGGTARDSGIDNSRTRSGRVLEQTGIAAGAGHLNVGVRHCRRGFSRVTGKLVAGPRTERRSVRRWSCGKRGKK